MMQKVLMSTFAVLALATGFAAQQFKPAIPKEIEALYPMVGEWKGHIGSESMPQISGPATIKITKILDGVYLQLELLHELPGPILVKGQTTFAWNDKSKKVQSFTWGNGGMEDPSRPREEFGVYKDGALTMEGRMNGMAYQQVYRVLPDGTLKYEFGMMQDGKLQPMGGGILKKSK